MTTNASPDRPEMAVGAARALAGASGPCITLGGARVDLMGEAAAVDMILEQVGSDTPPLAVVSANLDHLHHFGEGGRWHGVLEHAEAAGAVRVLTLLDGMPLVHRAQELTGAAWPRLAGSDLIGPILDAAERRGATVGFLGGSIETLAQLQAGLAVRRPALRIAGAWSPSRAELVDSGASLRLAEQIRHSGVDVLVIGLGKPRQELWIAEYAEATGAKALLAFGAVVDFLAGRVARAPEWVARAGLEWSYRLALEPRRLARRYLVDGPEAYVRLRHRSSLRDADRVRIHPADGELVDLTVVVLGAPEHGPRLAQELRAAAEPVSIRVTTMAEEPTSDAIDRVLARTGPTRAALVLTANSRLTAGAIGVLWKRLWQEGVGAVVPHVIAEDGRPVRTLGFEPRVLRVVGDRLLGDRLEKRPAWLTSVDRDIESYQHAHPVERATPTCLMVRRDAAASAATIRVPRPREAVDPLVSRLRAAGWSTWFEPGAVVEVLPGQTSDCDDLPKGSVVIPAHNEEAVLGRTLNRLRPAIDSGRLEVVVACNGCNDRTADIARSHAGVDVIEIDEADKPAALNAADTAAVLWPRLYLDADIAISPATVRAMFEALDGLDPRAARAPYRYDVTGASPLVRAYYRARSRLPVSSSDLWGAGAFAMNEAAHRLLGRFPEVVADDLYAGSVLPDECKVAVAADPVVVRTPRTARGLFNVVRRTFRGVDELARQTDAVDHTGRRTLGALIQTVRSPLSLADAMVYAGFALLARISVRLHASPAWERDDSSRVTGELA